MIRGAHCPVCEEPATGEPRCECGYFFDASDAAEARIRLGYLRRRARRLVRRGLGTLAATVALLAVVVNHPAGEQVELLTILVAQLALGTWWTARGITDDRRARRQLRAADAIGQLPAARVVRLPEPVE